MKKWVAFGNTKRFCDESADIIVWTWNFVLILQQEGRLCAQHCLNAALQGSYFTAVDLGELAMRLDEEERQQMSESDKGVES